MKSLVPNTVIDGFKLGEMRHKGGMALIYDVAYADGRAAPFPMVMKVPRMTAGDGAETIVSFEVEHQMMQALDGPHVPHLVAAGDLSVLPYLVMEYVPGRTLDHWLDQVNQGVLLAPETLAQLGAAVAHAAHSLHEQNAVHLDLKPANVIIKGDGTAVLLDFGLSFHAHYPDLLAEETRHAVGSPAYMSPEQVVGVRGDPRSDVYAIGVMLYELATGELPFGAPTSRGGLRQRLKGTGAGTHIKRWLRAAGAEYQPSPLPARQIAEVPILMVAVPHRDVTDATLYSLREAVGRSLGIRPGARLAVVTVVAPGAASTTDAGKSETALHRQMLAMLKNWSVGLKLDGHQVSYHVLEDGDPADAIVRYAETNRVGMIVMGAATHGLQLQRFVATVPIKVAMRAPCTVILVKQTMPFAELHQAGAKSEV